ncbi:hypothetical protein AMTRI_Chr05g59370 [Amborella trichopoda]
MTNQDTCLSEWPFTSKIHRRSHEKCWPGACWVFTRKIHRRSHENFSAFITLYLERLHGPRSHRCQHRRPCQARASSPSCPI